MEFFNSLTPEQTAFAIGMALKPFGALLLLLLAGLIARKVVVFIPEGRIKRLLLKRLN